MPAPPPTADDGTSQFPRLQAEWTPGARRALDLSIGPPLTVAITEKQHRQLVATLASMIIS